MIFLFCSLMFVFVSVVAFRHFGVPCPYSRGIVLSTGLSLLTTVCLGVNYSQSLIPNVHDGIGIANRLAYWIIGEDGWSIHLFKKYFDRSVYFTLFLLLVYPLVLLTETRMIKKASSS